MSDNGRYVRFRYFPSMQPHTTPYIPTHPAALPGAPPQRTTYNRVVQLVHRTTRLRLRTWTTTSTSY